MNGYPLICGVCEHRSFYVVPDGAASYLLECASCGTRSEVSAPHGITLTLTELPEVSEVERTIEETERGQ